MPDQPNYLIEEKDVPENWQDVKAAPIVPGETPAAVPAIPTVLPAYYRGSISSNLQHDAYFVATGRTPRITNMPLMPVAPSGNPQNNAAIQSSIAENASTTAVAATSTGMIFRGVWLGFVTYQIGNVVLYNESAYVAITASTGLEPDMNTTSWTLLSENLVFNAVPSTELVAGGVGPFDKSTQATGVSSTVLISGTPTASGEIAILQICSNGAAITTPSGWNILYQTAGETTTQVLYYKVLTSSALVSVSATLASSTNWASTLAFFQYGGFIVSNITATAVSGNVVTVTAPNTLVSGNLVNFQGLTKASFLNGTVGVVQTATSSSFTVNFITSGYATTSDTGTATLIARQVTSVSSGALSPPDSKTFSNPVTKGSIFAYVVYAVGGNGATFTSVTDTDLNSYHLQSAPSLDATADIAYTQNGTSGGTPTITLNSISGSANTVTQFAIEFAGSLSLPIYQPYDVFEFRGSMFVNLTQTNFDAFAAPADWALIGPGAGSVDILTASYPALASDNGRLLSFNSASSISLTLPSPPPAPPSGASEVSWWIAVQNIGAGTLTISPNGLTIDGSGSSLTLGQNQGLLIYADLTGNYKTMHGLTSLIVPSIFVNGGVNGSGAATLTLATETANTVFAGPATGAAAAPTFRVLVNADMPYATAPISKYNGIVTVGNGVPSEVATVDLTAQIATIGTTTLYAVPASGAGQYRLDWNSKVTTPATTSTLGPLTVIYTDPDGVVQTITAGAQSKAGAIETSDSGNSTTTVLLGLPMFLNCKASTNIQYAFTYASSAAATMQYNLHIKLEAM